MLVNGLSQLGASATAAKKDLNKRLKNLDSSTRGIFFMAFVCAVLPLDISQLAFAILGAVLYALLQKPDQLEAKKQPMPMSVLGNPPAPSSVNMRVPMPKPCPARPVNATSAHPKATVSTPSAKPEVLTTSVQPVEALTFQSKDWEGEVQELLVQITPTSEVEHIVNQLARVIRQTIQKTIPEAEVNGFANGNFTFGKAFGVAVPEVDIIASVNPQILFDRIHGRSAQGNASQLDPKKLQKSAIRHCTDQLISAAGFKFRRSAFGGQEPKVTLLAPSSLGLFSDAIAIDFSVNVVTPLYNMALLTECGKMDKRAKELILLVRRWAKVRGICHAAKGHLSPYMWSLLTMYYLQVGVNDDCPLLPPLEQFEMSSGLLPQASTSKIENTMKQQKRKPSETGPPQSVGVLFKDFVDFFENRFNWRNEAVSIRLGQRAPPSLDLPLHIIISDDSTTPQVGPSIEDPFHTAQNLGDGMTAASFARLKEELSRAGALCLRSASLAEVLEPWAPPDLEVADETQPLVKPACEPVTKTVPEALKSEDWRRDAMEAQAAAVTRSSTPPWRRPGNVAAARAQKGGS